MLPVAMALHLLLRSQAPVRSAWAAVAGTLGMSADGTLQSLLEAHGLTFQQVNIPTTVASAGLGVWLLMAKYAALGYTVFPRGVAWAGLIAGLGFVVLVSWCSCRAS